MTKPVPAISLKTLRQLAADAEVCEKTAARVVLNLPTRAGCRERVLEAAARLHIALPPPGGAS